MPALHYSSAGSGRPLMVLHGLFGSGKNWQSHTRQLAAHFEVFTVDLRNHGQSFHAEQMTYPLMAEDVAELLQQLDLGPCRLLGHSMGGKVAMMLANRYPELLSRLVVADIAPVAYYHHYDDLIEPILALPLDSLASRTDADIQLRQHIPEDQLRAFLLQSLARDADGWRWRVNWRVIQREMEWLTGFDEMPREWRIVQPTLFIRGAKSDYVGDPEIETIEAHFDSFEIATIEDAGHWLHAEQPHAFAARVLDFFQRD